MKKFLVALCIFFTLWKSSGQVPVYGIACVTPGVPYVYNFNGGWDSAASIQVCITGGILAEDSTTCKTAALLIAAKVIWLEGNTQGTVTITYPGGSTTKSIAIAQPLAGGTIDTASKTIFSDTLSAPATIHCPASAGCGCTPHYSYQWQQSPDILNWTDIAGSTQTNLSFNNPLQHSLYFRRKVTETQSGTIAYSDAAVVFVH